ncbi:MAG: 4Fe-4S dicluster domain-containing protein [Candidatus Eisenbacteria bacterium]|nr:4Fe-4S dicluster domain-containing protein [Candidatus Eisenbacteria bacterium]
MPINIAAAIEQAGVAGAGGAMFPTHVKAKSRAEIAIANGAECEPLLASDRVVMENLAHEVVKGLDLMQKSTGARKGIVAVKAKNKSALETIRNVASRYGDKEVFPLDDVYPAGDEHVLTYEVTGRVVPPGGIPIQVGVVVNNVTTLLQVSRALDGKVFTSRFVTVCGDVPIPKTLSFPLGTPVREALRVCGLTKTDDIDVIIGGPIMGYVPRTLDEPLTKGTAGIVVLRKDHILVAKKKVSSSIEVLRGNSACDQCFDCTELCPRYLLGHDIYPHKIMRTVSLLIDTAVDEITSALLCSECGICGLYACPQLLRPEVVNKKIKQELLKKGLRHDSRGISEEQKSLRDGRRIPMARMKARLGLESYSPPDMFDLRVLEVERVSIPLSQHTGVPSVPIVSVGQRVNEGQLIARIPDGKLGANIHASISGVVESVNGAITIRG